MFHGQFTHGVHVGLAIVAVLIHVLERYVIRMWFQALFVAVVGFGVAGVGIDRLHFDHLIFLLRTHWRQSEEVPRERDETHVKKYGFPILPYECYAICQDRTAGDVNSYADPKPQAAVRV